VTFRFFRRTLQFLPFRCVAALLWLVASSVSAQVLVVLSDESASYQEVADELRIRLTSGREGLRIEVLTAAALSNVDERDLGSYALVMTVGLAAAQAAVARENALAVLPPTLCLLIPRQSFERFVPTQAGARARRLSAVFIDQPLSRQLDLIRIALPDKSRVGVLLGPNSSEWQDELRDRARERSLTLAAAVVTEAAGVYGALQKVLPESDLLLALPDTVALNATTAYGVLLTSYRAKIPVVGFSEGLVKAGALLALYSSGRQQGKQGAEIANRILAGDGGLPAPQYPTYFTVRVNSSVARSLGIQMEEEATMAAALAARSHVVGDAREPRPVDASGTQRRGP